jgi:DNA topoisomerase I
MAVTNLLRDHFAEYVDIKFTRRMEEELDEIAQGDRKWVDHIRAFFKGTDSNLGLEAKVDSKQKDIDFPTFSLGVDPETNAPIRVRVGKFGAYLQKGENGEGVIANIPKGTAPADLTMPMVLKLLAQREEGPRVVGTDPVTGLNVYATIGRYGAYVQLGENPEDKKSPKPKRSSLEKGMDPDTVALEDALRLLSLPKDLGSHPEDGEPVMVNIGRFGPYVGHNKDFRSLKKEDDPYTVTYDRAMELLAQPKRTRGGAASAKTVLKELGEKEGVKIQVLDGRYGPYVTDGKVNATLPKDTDPEKVTMDQAMELIEAKEAAGPAKKRGSTRKKS